MTELPENFNFQFMEDLTIDGYALTHLPESMARMKNLKKVTIKNTRITQLPNGLFEECNRLETLDLSCNRLTKIEGNWYLPKIRELNLNRNQLTDLSNWNLTAPKLKTLSLEENNLTKLPAFLQNVTTNLPKLGTLYLDNNYLDLNDPETKQILESLQNSGVYLSSYELQRTQKPEQSQNSSEKDSKQEKL